MDPKTTLVLARFQLQDKINILRDLDHTILRLESEVDLHQLALEAPSDFYRNGKVTEASVKALTREIEGLRIQRTRAVDDLTVADNEFRYRLHLAGE